MKKVLLVFGLAACVMNAVAETSNDAVKQSIPVVNPQETITQTTDKVTQQQLDSVDTDVETSLDLKGADQSNTSISFDSIVNGQNHSDFEDLSPMGMYQKADWVVKAVMLLLVLASILSWTILLVKSFQFFQAKRRINQFKKKLKDVFDLNIFIGDQRNESAIEYRLVNEIKKECQWMAQNEKAVSVSGVKERAAQRLSKTTDDVTADISQGVSVLASISSTAPFIGLFGTVWGIMNSFIGIANAKTTNLAVVAPGIAEALLATAAGLVAAIPAALFYNLFVRKLANYRRDMSSISSDLMILLSKDLDDRFHVNPAFQTTNSVSDNSPEVTLIATAIK